MQTRSRKIASHQSDLKSKPKTKKGSKPSDVSDTTPGRKKNATVSPHIELKTKRQSTRVSQLQVEDSSVSRQSDQKTKAKTKTIKKTPVVHEKTPVWKKKNVLVSPLFDFKTKRRSSRVSLSKNKDIYDFPCEGDNKENVINKKKKRKPQVKKKKLKSSIKNGMLTTDPLFKPTIAKPIATSAFYAVRKDNKLPLANRPTDSCRENDPEDQSDVYSHFGDDTVDDAGYEASISVANDTEGTCLSLANPALSVLPTPTALRFPGTASTPIVYEDRYDFNPFTNNRGFEPVTHEEEVKLCFGFDDSEDDSSIGLSPVKKHKQLSLLHQASMSVFLNVEEIEPVPTRFVTARFKRPMPMVMEKVNKKTTIKKRCTSTKENPRKRRRINTDQSLPEVGSDPSAKECNKSVLFDEGQEEFNSGIDGLKSPSKPILKFVPKNILKNLAVVNMPSPEKSFTAPPRKSYDRKSLEVVRWKFHKDFAGGYPTTDTDTENEEPRELDRITRRKRKDKTKVKPSTSDEKATLSRKIYKKKKKQKENRTPSRSKQNKKDTEKHKNSNKFDKTVSDWASDINSHFSEIDDVDLLIE